MFKPQVFAEDRLEVLQGFINQHPLGLLSSIGTYNKIEANLIPMVLYPNKDKGVLRCHLTRMNSQITSLKDSQEVLVVFSGADGYVSPVLYQTKKLHGKAVPTWNYSMVQVRGKPTIIDDSKWILQQIEDMTNTLEAKSSHPWNVEDAPEDYIQSQLKLIVGLEISITNIEGKFKVSQNHPDENRNGVEKHFREIGNEEMADYVLNRGAIKKN